MIIAAKSIRSAKKAPVDEKLQEVYSLIDEGLPLSDDRIVERYSYVESSKKCVIGTNTSDQEMKLECEANIL